MVRSVTWKIAGEAGFGIMSAGNMIAKIFSRAGYHTFAINEYPSLIRGGHNVITVRIATERFESLNRDIHILVALNKETVEIHKNELSPDTIVLYDPKDYEWKSDALSKSMKTLAVPLTAITEKFGGEPVMRNTVALGATLALIGAQFSPLGDMLEKQFKKKGDDVVKQNVSVARAGYDHIKTLYPGETSVQLAPAASKGKQLILNGSEVLAAAAVRSGVKFAAIYPMTPINSVITYLADHAKKYNLVYRQPEDEIAGINMAIGASVAGVRSLVATSGGGFALMVEGLALSGMIEAPLVIDLGMRAGPATGMPTWTEQGELRFVIHAGHGEFARIVLAPGDAEETFQLTIDAFNLADKFQIPVFILTDKYLNESQWCMRFEDFTGKVTIDRGKLLTKEQVARISNFKRYSVDTDDGVSPRSLPGMPGGYYIANSYEHDETGLVTDNPGLRTAMASKRMKKFTAIGCIIPPPKIFGEKDADITFVSWGTNKGPILEAMKLLSVKRISSQYIHYSWLFPFPAESSIPLLAKAKRVIDVEQNATAQLLGLIRQYTGYEIKETVLKFDGRPFDPEEIIERIHI